MTEDVEKMRRHLGYGKLVVKDKDGIEDTFRLMVPTFEVMPELFAVAAKMGTKELSEEDAMEKIKEWDKDAFESINRVIKNVVDSSFPDASKEEREAFATAHYMDIMSSAIEAINLQSKDRKALKEVNALRKRMKDAKKTDPKGDIRGEKKR